MTTTTRPSSSRQPAQQPQLRPGAGARVVDAVAGIAAGGLTLAVADLVAQVVDPAASPLIAVGGTFIDLTPGWLKDFAVSTFGTNDKLVLLLSMGAVITALAAVAGLAVRRRPRVAAALVLLLGIVAALAAATRPVAGPLAVVPSLVGLAAGLAALLLYARVLRGRGPRRLRAPAPGAAPAEVTPARPAPARRQVLGTVVGTAGVAVLAGAAGRLLPDVTGHGTGPQDVRLPAAADPAKGDLAATSVGVAGVTPFVTAARDFYRIDTALAVPQLDASRWRLRLHGLVDREIELSFRDLLAMPLVERTITLTCVSNEVGGTLAGNATWLGVPVRTLLERAGVRPEADMVLSRSSDGFTASTPVAALTDGRDALLAVGMNGAPLPYEHGFPVRMVVPGLYGFVSATKWLVDLEVTRFDRAQAYWTRRGWSPEAPIRTFSRIDVPRPFAQAKAGTVAVGGVAWAQHRGVNGVEVRVDGGPWSPARLGGVPSVDTWRQWSWEWDATPGLHRLEVRATDALGDTQPETRRPPKPDGATGWHSVTVTVT
ncbi:MAG TPA: molybdopterin-dependent oxidoreductase [Kineosporiaceae bacterium]|nr:molybdopterin-dependent oxidoreductase [Kineosporiaceae bacterium]